MEMEIIYRNYDVGSDMSLLAYGDIIFLDFYADGRFERYAMFHDDKGCSHKIKSEDILIIKVLKE